MLAQCATEGQKECEREREKVRGKERDREREFIECDAGAFIAFVYLNIL